MEFKLFGKSLFSFKGKGSYLLPPAYNEIKESKFLIDFYKDTGGELSSGSISDWVTIQSAVSGATIVGPSNEKKISKKKVEVKAPEKKIFTPKEVHQLGMLHDKTFTLNTDAAYIDQQLAGFKDKLALIKSEEYDMRRGTTEIASIVQRLENRKKYADLKEVFDEFPYTTTSLINKVIKENDYLQLGQVAQFMADMPNDAVDAMKRYNKGCEKLCGKQAVFYIIANKNDFKKSDKRRDPILLAQSPFGHFWQILGAWDKEMMFLEQL